MPRLKLAHFRLEWLHSASNVPSLDTLPQEKAKRDLSGYNLFCKAYREQKVHHHTMTPTANLSRTRTFYMPLR